MLSYDDWKAQEPVQHDEPECDSHPAELLADELERRGLSPVTSLEDIVDQLRSDADEVGSLRDQLASAERARDRLKFALSAVEYERDCMARRIEVLERNAVAVRDSVMAQLRAALASGNAAELAKVARAIVTSGELAECAQ